MEPEESIVVRELHKRLNARLHEMNLRDLTEAEKVIDVLVEEIEIEISHDASLIPAEMKEELYTNLGDWEAKREESAQLLRSQVAESFGEQFSLLNRALAIAELEAVRLETVFKDSFRSILLTKVPRPDPIAVTGAPLKCLLLLSLQSKICVIAGEIVNLMKEVFLDGAESRLRTLHEHLVVATLITNDHTYELSERYQDHAVFEDLKRLRAIKRNVLDHVYNTDPEREKQVDEEIASAERVGRRAQERWGSDVKEQYGWSRPGLPAHIRVNRPISFVDLERAAGAEIFRPDYLTGNDYVHAGAFAAINQLNIQRTGKGLFKSRDYRDDARLSDIGKRTAKYLGLATSFIGKGVACEAEIYDELLMASEAARLAEEAARSFAEHSRPSLNEHGDNAQDQ